MICALPSAALAQAQEQVAPGDRVIVRLLETEFDYAAVFDERLRIDLPVVGAFVAGALPPATVQDSIIALYARYIRPGGVLVQFQRRISIVGDVKNPNAHYLDLTVRLRDAVAMAGGVTENGKPNVLRLTRNGETRTIQNWSTGEFGSIPLRSGDQIVIPREPWYKRNAVPLLSVMSAVGTVLVTLLAR